ncbi:MAG TPA: M14 family zinc carboxypeptidase, partial [Vicinamibacterales bacterium]|nr:M14 family zinc carboxypeptidase [Vicinamibacterales bacterium]
MRRAATIALAGALMTCAGSTGFTQSPANPYARDAKQQVDDAYTKKLKEYTTESYFTSPLVDYLPASKTVPTPQAVLGDIAGAPGKLPYVREVHQYMRMVEKASPRVKVFSIGKSEEGREMIAVAVSSEANLAKLEENRSRLAKLADPRIIAMNDAEADKLVDQSVPVYYITGAIHAPETGSPTALMELVYRLAVDDSPYIQKIRSRIVTLITPIVEVDGRDRQVDIYRWHLANPDKHWPSLIYWGKYVAHDNNRDAMALTLNLTRNVLNTYTGWKAQVLHDLHESVAYLYDNTVGDGPYNAWLDPILTDEWQMIGWHNVSEMTKMGMPGVFTHGTFDTWTPGYLMFVAATHNGISRLYETFGNGGADTLERTLGANDTARTWYKQNPPLPKAKWSQRNNNNYQQTGLLVSLNHFADNKNLFLKNFYLKSKRSILKARTEGPAAYVFPADDPRLGPQADLLRILQLQGCEISRATAPFTVTLPGRKRPARETTNDAAPRDGGGPNVQEKTEKPEKTEAAKPETRTFPAGSYVLRMDQPYSRIADTLLDYQYWAPDDPQRNPYDDTGWTFGELFNVKVVRVTDPSVLDAKLDLVKGELKAVGSVNGTGTLFAINHNADPSLATLRYRFKDASFEMAEEPFESAGSKFNRGTFLVRGVPADDLGRAAAELGLTAVALTAPPSIKTHPAKAARIALMHTWINTQDEGWWRLALDQIAVPYSYISTQDVAGDGDLRSKYDVILFPPVGRNAGQQIVSGLPSYSNPLPWKTTELTPNIGKIDATDDMRPGMGWEGLANLQKFIRNGGVLITVDDTSNFAIQYGFTPGVSVTAAQRLKITG